MKVWILTRLTADHYIAIDGVYTSEAKAKKGKKDLLKDFGIEDEDESDDEWEIHQEEVI